MFGRVKRYLGIEGVKVVLDIPSEIKASEGIITGKVQFYSMHDQTVTWIHVKMVEKYKRGRRKSKLVDEYILGEIEMEQEIQINAEEPASIDFTLEFDVLKSPMDRFGESNFLARGLTGVAKFLKNVKSEYRVVAEAKVKGTALNPFDKQVISLS